MNIPGMYRDHYPKLKVHFSNLGLRLRWAAFLSTTAFQSIHVSSMWSPARYVDRKQSIIIFKSVKRTTFLYIFPCKQVWGLYVSHHCKLTFIPAESHSLIRVAPYRQMG